MTNFPQAVSQGDHFILTTRKEVNLLPGAPASIVTKESTYAVVCGETLHRMVKSPIRPTWWRYIDEAKKVVKHIRKHKHYLLCALDKNAQTGRSVFYGNGAAWEKADLKKWLPHQVFDGEAMTIPFDTIINMVPNNNYPEPVYTTTPTVGRKVLW